MVQLREPVAVLNHIVCLSKVGAPLELNIFSCYKHKLHCILLQFMRNPVVVFDVVNMGSYLGGLQKYVRSV